MFHQSNCVSAIKRILFYNRHIFIFLFFDLFVSSLLVPCMHKHTSLRVRVKTSYNTNCSLNRLNVWLKLLFIRWLSHVKNAGCKSYYIFEANALSKKFVQNIRFPITTCHYPGETLHLFISNNLKSNSALHGCVCNTIKFDMEMNVILFYFCVCFWLQTLILLGMTWLSFVKMFIWINLIW